MDAPVPSARQAPYIAGLDVGQMADPSALAILERDIALPKGKVQARYSARWLERFPLQTPYPVLVRLVRERLEKLGQHCLLVVDITGVGRGIVDMLREEWMDRHPVTHDRQVRHGKPTLIAVTLLTSAMHAARAVTWDEHHVPKRDVVMTFLLTLQQRRFRAARGLKEAELLFKEGQNFQWKVSPSGQDQYGAWREGQHDDLLLATALAVWWGEYQGPLLHTAGRPQQYATASASPFAGRAGAGSQGASGGMRR